MARLVQVMTVCLVAFGTLTGAAQDVPRLTVFAAASLTNAFADLTAAFMQTHPVEITLSTAGSSTLATQIEQGAPVDIFASANIQQMQRLVDGSFIQDDTVTTFATNELAIITPTDNPANIRSAADLARAGVVLVIAQPGVPVREYTDDLLQTLTTRYGDTYIADVYANVVSEPGNVRQVAARVALGEADAGIVYRTDITPDIADDVRVIALPDGTSPQAQYVIAPVSDGSADNPDSAQQFIDFVLSDAGQAILREWGFCPPPEPMPESTPEATPETTSEATPAVTPEATPPVTVPCE